MRTNTLLWLVPCLLAFGSTAWAGELQVGEIESLGVVKDKYPYWSPDGSQIVFQSNRSGAWQIHVVNADGSGLRRLTHDEANDETPVWHPDGEHILFVSDRDGNLELYLMDADGRNQRNLTNHPAPDGHPKFSFDGKRIIFNSGRASDPALYGGEVMARDMNHEIYEMALDGSDLRRLTDHPLWDTYPSISPDGRHIAFRRVIVNGAGDRDSEVFIAERDGSNPRNLTNDAAFDGYPAWSADGSKLVFASNRDGGEDFSDFNVYAVNPDGTGLQRLTHSPGYEDARPIFTRDGTRIVFNRQIGGTGAMEIFIVPVQPASVASR